jgi:hypothetical protein
MSKVSDVLKGRGEPAADRSPVSKRTPAALRERAKARQEESKKRTANAVSMAVSKGKTTPEEIAGDKKEADRKTAEDRLSDRKPPEYSPSAAASRAASAISSGREAKRERDAGVKESIRSDRRTAAEEASRKKKESANISKIGGSDDVSREAVRKEVVEGRGARGRYGKSDKPRRSMQYISTPTEESRKKLAEKKSRESAAGREAAEKKKARLSSVAGPVTKSAQRNLFTGMTDEEAKEDRRMKPGSRWVEPRKKTASKSFKGKQFNLF